jgi:hypothetical protein
MGLFGRDSLQLSCGWNAARTKASADAVYGELHRDRGPRKRGVLTIQYRNHT